MLSPNETRWDALVFAAASSESLEPALIKAVIWNESQFRFPVEDREEPKLQDASVGVMQVLTKTAEWLYGVPVSREQLRDPAYNIYTGTRILSMYVNGWRPDGSGGRTQGAADPFSLPETLAAYNGGPGMVLRQRTRGGAYGNQGYVDKALSAYNYFTSLDTGPSQTGFGPGGVGGVGAGAILLLLVLGGVFLAKFRG